MYIWIQRCFISTKLIIWLHRLIYSFCVSSCLFKYALLYHYKLCIKFTRIHDCIYITLKCGKHTANFKLRESLVYMLCISVLIMSCYTCPLLVAMELVYATCIAHYSQKLFVYKCTVYYTSIFDDNAI